MDQDSHIAPDPPELPEPPSPRRGEHNRVVADAGKLSGAIGFAYAVNLIGGLVVAGILGKTMLGVWKTVQLTVQYTQFANLGVSYGVHKLSPALVSKGLIRRYRKLMGVSMGFGLLLPLVSSGALLVVSFFVESEFSRLGLLALVIIIPMQQFYHHAELALAIEKRFGTKAKSILGYTVARVVLSILLAIWLGLSGVLIAYIVTVAAVSFYMIRHSRMGLELAVRPRFAWKLIGVGLPITLIVAGELVLGTADKWVVRAALGEEALGVYSMAFFPIPILMLIPVSLRQVVNIEVFDKFGQTRDLRLSRAVYEHSTLIAALLAPVVIGAVYLGIPWLIDWRLSDFRDSIFAIKAHAILAFSLLIVQTGTGVMIVSGRERTIFAAQVGVAVVCAAFSVAVISLFHVDFNTVLFIHGAGWLLYAVGFLYATSRLLGGSAGVSARQTVFWLLPMAFVAVELPALSWALVRLGAPANTFLHAAGGGLVHLVLCAPLLWYLEKRTGTIRSGIRVTRRRLGL